MSEKICPDCGAEHDDVTFGYHACKAPLKPTTVKAINDRCLKRMTEPRSNIKQTLYEILQKAKARNESWEVTFPNTPNDYEQGYIHGLEYALLLIKLEEYSK